MTTQTERDRAELTRTAPERIWLLVSDDEEHRSEPFPYGAEVSWSDDQALSCNVEYVRADVAARAQQAEAEPVALWGGFDVSRLHAIKAAINEGRGVEALPLLDECINSISRYPTPAPVVPNRDDIIQCLLSTMGQSEGIAADAILGILRSSPQPAEQEDES